MKKKIILLVFGLITVFILTLIYFTTENYDNTPKIEYPQLQIGNTLIHKNQLIYEYASPLYFERSNESAVLIIHGYLASPQEVQALANYLADQGHSVFVPLMSGHGTSIQDLEQTTWELWQRESEEYYKILKESYPQVHVIGFSLGSLSTLSLAKNHDLDSLTIVGSPIFTIADDLELLEPEERISQLSQHIPQLRKPAIKDKVVERRTYQAIPLSSVNEVLEYSQVIRQGLDSIDEPTLIVHGKFDLAANPQSAPFIFDNINSTIKKVYYVDSSHTVLNGLFQKDVFERITSFLETFP